MDPSFEDQAIAAARTAAATAADSGEVDSQEQRQNQGWVTTPDSDFSSFFNDFTPILIDFFQLVFQFYIPNFNTNSFDYNFRNYDCTFAA